MLADPRGFRRARLALARLARRNDPGGVGVHLLGRGRRHAHRRRHRPPPAAWPGVHSIHELSRIEALRPEIVAITASLLESMDGLMGVVDLKQRLSLPLPLTVIGELLASPTATATAPRAVIACSTAHQPRRGRRHPRGPASCPRRARRDQSAASWSGSDRALIAARDGEDRLSETELIWTLILMVGTGSNRREPDHQRRPRALGPSRPARSGPGRSMPWSAVVEETARSDPSIADLPFRYATEDVDLDGVRIPAGEAVLMCSASAGRDLDQHARTPAGSTSPARSATTWPSATGRPAASALRSPVWRARSRCACSSTTSRPRARHPAGRLSPRALHRRQRPGRAPGLPAREHPAADRPQHRWKTPRHRKVRCGAFTIHAVQHDDPPSSTAQSEPDTRRHHGTRELHWQHQRDAADPRYVRRDRLRTNPADEHNWWYWHGQAPLAAAHQSSKAVTAIEPGRAERRSATWQQRSRLTHIESTGMDHVFILRRTSTTPHAPRRAAPGDRYGAPAEDALLIAINLFGVSSAGGSHRARVQSVCSPGRRSRGRSSFPSTPRPRRSGLVGTS